jgi:hypothetical protein
MKDIPKAYIGQYSYFHQHLGEYCANLTMKPWVILPYHIRQPGQNSQIAQN